jgi:4-hydroxy 2-oxovalerate aldolase
MTKLLDCTLRDGGYVNNWKFTDYQVSECYSACCDAGIDYIELGFRNRQTESNLRNYGSTFFCTEEFINRITGDKIGSDIAVMVTINEFDINDFIPATQSKIKLVRVLMAYHGGKNGDDTVLDINQLMNGVSQIKQLIDLGYKVSFNIGRIDKISYEQLKDICSILSNTSISYFVMADTYGSVTLDIVETLIPFVRNLLPNRIGIGFHAHDNCSDGTAKAIHSLKYGTDIVDGCILGFGRGSGNAKTELLAMRFDKRYDILPIIEYGDNHIASYKNCNGVTSYNVIYALTSYFGCHVSYAIDIIEKYDKMSVKVIIKALQTMKSINKHMFYNDRVFNDIVRNMNI